jgi:putative transposase
MARRMARELDKILDGGNPKQVAIKRAAAELQITTRQTYNLLARYRTDRTLTSWLPRTAVIRRKRLPEQVEAKLAAPFRERWLTLERPHLLPWSTRSARCEEGGLAIPSYVTVARRIPMLFSQEEIAKNRSANPKHLLWLKPRPGYIHAPHPLAVCQIDHTPTDMNFVEVIDGAGVFVGHPYSPKPCTRKIYGLQRSISITLGRC